MGLDGIDRDVVEVTTATRKRNHKVIVHRSSDLEANDLIRRHGLLITTPTRTLIDLAGVVDESSLARALDSALRRQMTHLALLHNRLETLTTRGRHGIATLLELLDARERACGLTESPLEVRVEAILRRHGLDPPSRQHTVVCPDGTRVRLDFAWPEQKVSLELDA